MRLAAEISCFQQINLFPCCVAVEWNDEMRIGYGGRDKEKD